MVSKDAAVGQTHAATNIMQLESTADIKIAAKRAPLESIEEENEDADIETRMEVGGLAQEI